MAQFTLFRKKKPGPPKVPLRQKLAQTFPRLAQPTEKKRLLTQKFARLLQRVPPPTKVPKREYVALLREVRTFPTVPTPPPRVRLPWARPVPRPGVPPALPTPPPAHKVRIPTGSIPIGHKVSIPIAHKVRTPIGRIEPKPTQIARIRDRWHKITEALKPGPGLTPSQKTQLSEALKTVVKPEVSPEKITQAKTVITTLWPKLTIPERVKPRIKETIEKVIRERERAIKEAQEAPPKVKVPLKEKLVAGFPRPTAKYWQLKQRVVGGLHKPPGIPPQKVPLRQKLVTLFPWLVRARAYERKVVAKIKAPPAVPPRPTPRPLGWYQKITGFSGRVWRAVRGTPEERARIAAEKERARAARAEEKARIAAARPRVTGIPVGVGGPEYSGLIFKFIIILIILAAIIGVISGVFR